MEIKNKKILLPSLVKEVFDMLEKNNFQTFLVGGSVRDSVLGQETSDYDMITDATPEEISRIFSTYNILEVGKSFGITMIEKEGALVELATFRKEEGYQDGRRPDKVFYTDSLEEDLKRRDFTINTLVYNPKTGVLDLLGGMEDLGKGLVRTVGSAEKRLAEDHLRILRAIRFATSLDFDIDKELYSAIKSHAQSLKKISPERIREEINKILLSKTPSKGFDLMYNTGVLDYIMPEISKMVGFNQESTFHHLDLYQHTMRALDLSKPVLTVRLAALFHDLGKLETFFIDERGEGRFFGHQQVSKDYTRAIMKRLKYPKKITDSVGNLVERHMDNTNTYTEKSIKKLMARMGEDLHSLFDLQEADILATNCPENLANVTRGKELAEELKERQVPISSNDLVINGHDLKKIGYKEGKILGDVLKYLTDLIIDDESKNNKKYLLAKAKDILKNTEEI